MRKTLLLVIIYIGFISLGLPDTILGVSWAPMRETFDKPVYYAGFLATLLTACSATSAVFSGAILRYFGTGRLLAGCGCMTGCALLGYALSPTYAVVLLCSIPLGFGQGAIDTGMNYYVAKHYTSRDMSWLHGCWGIGASAAPFVMTMLLAHGSSWRVGYTVIAIVQLILATVFLMTLRLWHDASHESATSASARSTVHYSARMFACPMVQFLYCGMEASVGLWAYQFLTLSRGATPVAAGCAVTVYWSLLTVGRFVIGCMANRLGNRRQLHYSLAVACVGIVLLTLPLSVTVAFVALGVLGFALAPFYPAMMHAAPERFDDATAATVIGWQGGAGMVGNALIPVAFGIVAAHSTFALLPYVLIGLISLIAALIYWIDR